MPLALITGGASLICEGVAQCLARDGWDLAITDLNLEGAEVGGLAHRKAADGSRRMRSTRGRSAMSMRWCATLRSATAPSTGLVNGAGGARGIGFQRKPFVETSQSEWESLLNSNLNTVLNVTRTVLPVMIAAEARRHRQHRGEPRLARRTGRLDLLGREGRHHRRSRSRSRRRSASMACASIP